MCIRKRRESERPALFETLLGQTEDKEKAVQRPTRSSSILHLLIPSLYSFPTTRIIQSQSFNQPNLKPSSLSNIMGLFSSVSKQARKIKNHPVESVFGRRLPKPPKNPDGSRSSDYDPAYYNVPYPPGPYRKRCPMCNDRHRLEERMCSRACLGRKGPGERYVLQDGDRLRWVG